MNKLFEQLEVWFSAELGLQQKVGPIVMDLIILAVLLVLAFIANYVAKRFILKLVEHFASKSSTKWDDVLVKRKFFRRLSHFAPALVIYLMSSVFFENDTAILVTRRIAAIYMLFVAIITIDAFLSSVVDIYHSYDTSRKVPVRIIVQVAKILLYAVVGIVILSTVIGKSPAFFIGGLGAMAAVLMLIFKDSILGLTAGIQLSANKMVRVGDWIEMPKYGADGDIIDISLTTVKVQNWDKTIITIPTFALVSEGVKNWRGMSESGGRRIKRSIYIDMTSVKFCTEEMTEKFSKIKYLSDYIRNKGKELSEFNSQKNIDDSVLVNGRRMTNIGTFRAYLVSYLKDHPKINKNLTFLVRQLDPGPNGLPIEIYVFSNDQVWANYEAIQADIFDHILAVIPEFELKVFQNPTGADFQNLAH
ncbi:MAG: mechanosensitive ion channel [Candidatus Dadabacteria bacterium]|nr:MAG: mechanosensitive ion channel [Candidatus Dadabacteria bacterium]